MEKIVQREHENPASNGREMIDDFRLWGSSRCRHMGGHLTKEGGARRWCTRWRVSSTTPPLHSQRAHPSPSWSRLCRETRIGQELARIAQILWGKARCGAGPARPRLARRVVAPHGRGGKWRERPRVFCRWCGTGQGKVVHGKIHHHPSPFRGRSLHSDPWREGRHSGDEAQVGTLTTGEAREGPTQAAACFRPAARNSDHCSIRTRRRSNRSERA